MAKSLMANMNQNVLGTEIRPASFEEAARRHGRFFARYVYASRCAAGKRVADIACGSGYGSALLACVASRVAGFDLDPDMVELAQRTWSGGNLRFVVHDLHQPLPDAPFDLVTCFQTLEHVRDPRVCLMNLARSLAPEGCVMVSIPNGAKELAAAKDRPYHQVHYSADAFRGMLAERFAQVEHFSQTYKKSFRHYLLKLTGRGSHHSSFYRFEPGLSESAKTWLAVARSPFGDSAKAVTA